MQKCPKTFVHDYRCKRGSYTKATDRLLQSIAEMTCLDEQTIPEIGFHMPQRTLNKELFPLPSREKYNYEF